MSENGKTLFSKRVGGGKNRNYFIDVRQSEKTGNKYLAISESRISEGSWTSQRVMIFPDRLEEWKQTLDEAVKLVQE